MLHNLLLILLHIFHQWILWYPRRLEILLVVLYWLSWLQKNIPVVVAVMINPSLIESSMFFSPINTTHLFTKLSIIILLNLKHAESSWVYSLFLHLIFIQGLKIFVVICKKNTSTYGQNCSYNNTIDIGIIWSSGRCISRGRSKRCRATRRRCRVIRRRRCWKMIFLVCFLSSIRRNQANTRFSVLKVKHPLRKRALVKNIVVSDTNSL